MAWRSRRTCFTGMRGAIKLDKAGRRHFWIARRRIIRGGFIALSFSRKGDLDLPTGEICEIEGHRGQCHSFSYSTPASITFPGRVTSIWAKFAARWTCLYGVPVWPVYVNSERTDSCPAL